MVADEKVGIVVVVVVSPLYWYKVFPLNYEKSRGVPVAAELHDNFILTPNLSWKVVAVAAVTKQSPLDWAKVKDSVMLDAVRAKFNQYDELKELLLSTGDAKIVEHTANDSYWGNGGDGKGKNRLGQILMLVRRELREKDG